MCRYAFLCGEDNPFAGITADGEYVDPKGGNLGFYKMNGVHRHGDMTWIAGSIFYVFVLFGAVLLKWMGKVAADDTGDLDQEETPKFGVASGFGNANADY